MIKPPPRTQPVPDADTWQQRPEAGNRLALRFMLWVAQHFGRRWLHLLLYPIAAYFYCVRAPERKASAEFLARALPHPVRAKHVFRHFLQFAKVTADRFYFLVDEGAKIPVTFVGEDALNTVLERNGAGIFLAAHFGSFEAARVLGPQAGDIDLRIVLDKRISERLVATLRELNPALVDKIIDSGQGAVALGLTIADALRQGDWVGFLADRYRPGDRTLEHDFFGEPAAFPIGPYLIANTVKAPVIGIFCRVTPEGYEVHCEVLSESVQLERRHRAAQLATLSARYVERLEHHVRASPYGWFNFFDFWGQQPPVESGTTTLVQP